MNDFGRRLEAGLAQLLSALDRCAPSRMAFEWLLSIVRAANAQDSAPAPGSVSSASQGLSDGTTGAGVDLADAMRSLQFCIQTPGLNISAMLKAAQCRALLSHIESLERDAARYRWLRDTPIWPNSILPRHTGEAWDAAIDAARKEGKP